MVFRPKESTLSLAAAAAEHRELSPQVGCRMKLLSRSLSNQEAEELQHHTDHLEVTESRCLQVFLSNAVFLSD